MAFRVPYRMYPDGRGSLLPTVLFDLIISSPNGRKGVPVQGIVDCGAGRCIFDARLAKMMGIDLMSGERTVAQGIGCIVNIWLHDVVLHLPGGPRTPVRAGFQQDLPVAGLLGMAGFFEHFRITFDGAGRHCEFERLPTP